MIELSRKITKYSTYHVHCTITCYSICPHLYVSPYFTSSHPFFEQASECLRRKIRLGVFFYRPNLGEKERKKHTSDVAIFSRVFFDRYKKFWWNKKEYK